jgi:hypothetical protein
VSKWAFIFGLENKAENEELETDIMMPRHDGAGCACWAASKDTIRELH